jgi:hypothetical protein
MTLTQKKMYSTLRYGRSGKGPYFKLFMTQSAYGKVIKYKRTKSQLQTDDKITFVCNFDMTQSAYGKVIKYKRTKSQLPRYDAVCLWQSYYLGMTQSAYGKVIKYKRTKSQLQTDDKITFNNLLIP